ncbi:MAG: lamin tail domain-containing protein [Flavobacteriales bacterium]|nr:lamin tail domain-containing protein [Flavobacteriales bacterium]
MIRFFSFIGLAMAILTSFGLTAQNNALSMNGSSHAFSLSVDDIYLGYTAELWVKPSSVSGSQAIISHSDGSSATSNMHALGISGGKFVHYTYDLGATSGKTVTGTTTLSANTWYHVAITAKPSGTMKLYVNGILEGTPQSITSLDYNSGDQYYFGHNNGIFSSNFSGEMDEFRLWDVERTANQLNSNKNINVRTQSNLLVYYKFNQTSGNLIDSSGNNVLGLNSGATYVTSGVTINHPPVENLVFTEINYNPSESGVDTTEYIEIYNNGNSAVNLNGYYFSGVTYTFPNVSLNAGDYILVGVSSRAINIIYGKTVYQWTSGSFSNNGESLVLKDNLNRTVDSVYYRDVTPWPTGGAAGQPDGGGASIVLCDVNADHNNGANWKSSTSVVSGQIINGYQVYGSPGASDAACVTPLAITLKSSKMPSCNTGSDGYAVVELANGTANYTYKWSTGDSTVNTTATTDSLSGLQSGNYSVIVIDGNGDKDTVSFTISQPTALVATATITSNYNGKHVSCFGSSDGTASVAVSGGTASYTYLWSNSATTAATTSLSAGSKMVTVTDANGCTASDTVTLLNPTVLTSSTTLDSNVSCNGGADGGVSSSYSGGTGSVTYAWSNGATTAAITGVGTGTYSVTITDANGCTSNSSKTISQPTVLVATASVDSSVSCFGLSDGRSTVLASGGSTPYTYSWSNSATTTTASGLAAGTYSVSVTDAKGCMISKSVMVTQPTQLVVSTTVDSVASCSTAQNGGASASASGGILNYTFLWSNSSTNSALTQALPDVYMVTVTDANGCTDTASTSIGIIKTLVAQATVNTNVFCFGGNNGLASVTSTGGKSPLSYYWSNADTTSVSGSLISGFYYVTVTDANTCSDSEMVFVNQPSLLTATASLDSNVICLGESNGQASVASLGGNGGNSFLWSTSDTTSVAKNLALGNYSVTVTDSLGCMDADTLFVGYRGNYTPPTVTFPDPSAVCLSIDSLILNSATPMGGVYSGKNVVDSVLHVTSAGVGLDTLYYVFTDTLGCVTSDTASILVNANPVSTFSALASVCSNASSFNLTGGLPTGGSYAGSGVNAGVFYPDTAGVGMHNIAYVFTDTNNCSDTAFQMQTVDSLPIVSFATQQNWCLNANALVFKSGLPLGGVYTINGVLDSIYKPTLAGMDTVVYSFTDANLCFAADTSFIRADTVPVVTFDAVNGACVGSDTITLMQGLPSGGVYNGNNTVLGKYIPNHSGIDTLSYIFTDANMCSDSATQTIEVFALPVVTLDTLAAVCANTPAFALTAGKPITGTYSGTGVFNNQFVADSSGIGSFQITYVVLDSHLCSDSASTQIIVNPTPTVVFSGLGSTCENSGLLSLSGLGTPAGGTYSGNGVAGVQFDPMQTGAGSFTLSYLVVDSNNCSDSATDSILVEAIPQFQITGDSVGCGEKLPQLSSSVSGLSYKWSNGSTSESTTYNTSGIAWLVVTDSSTIGNCMNGDSVNVVYEAECLSVEPLFSNSSISYFPNPNNGNFNYRFEGLQNKALHLSVHNSLGKLVYETKWISNDSMDSGTIELVDVESGIYFISLISENQKVVHRITVNH